MPVAGQIHDNVKKLSNTLQTEVLHFVEILLAKTEQRTEQADGEDWTAISRALALRGMEDEEGPEYTEDDLKERTS